MSDTLDLTTPSEEPVISEVVEDAEPVEEEPAPVVEEEPAPVVEEEPAPDEPPAPTTEEVVETVQSMLTEPVATSSGSTDLEERVKVLEESLENLLNILSKQPNGMGGFIYE